MTSLNAGAPPPLQWTLGLHRIPEVLRKGRFYCDIQFRPEELRSFQIQRLRKLLLHAVEHVPAYRNIGISPSDVYSDPFSTLKEFPLIDKRMLRDNLVDYVSDDFDPTRAFKLKTSGSTGVPLVLVDDEDSLIEYAAVYYRVLEEFNIPTGSLICHLIADARQAPYAIETQLFAGLSEVARVNMLSSDSRLRCEAIEYIQNVQPILIFGNPSDLLLLACEVNRLGITIKPPKVVISCGENLSQLACHRIELSIGCKVAEIYSMQECKAIAWQCSSEKLHINDDRVIVEENYLSPGRGELVITNLTNFTMPLIRYRSGDIGKVRTHFENLCSCGRSLNVLTEFEGRDRGFIHTPDGRFFSPREIKSILTDLPLLSWQLLQDRRDEITLKIAAQPGHSEKHLAAQISQIVEELLDGQVSVLIEVLPFERMFEGSGKFQMMKLNAGAEGVAV